jgi:isopenicillin-N N-acyltransferase-like protein
VSDFPLVQVEGGPRDRGRQYGRQATDRIGKSLEIYTAAFGAKGLGWDKVRRIAARFAESIPPAFMEEIEGIAEGAGLEPAHVIALNARTELLYWREAEEGCTGAACLPEVTADGHTLLGQNWDWRPPCRDSAVVLHARPSDGPEFITFVEAGLLARSGLNAAGVGITGNFLQSDQDFGRQGVPIPFIRRQILMSRSLAQAVGAVVRAPRAFSSNHLIAHAGAADGQPVGAAIDCESAPAEVFFLQAEDGILAHSNHFRSPAAQAKLQDTGIGRYPDSLYRDGRLRQLLRQRAPRITVADFQAALADHYGKPDSVCRHEAARPDGTAIMTVASVVMDLTARRMWVAPGPVCEHQYTEYRLEA